MFVKFTPDKSALTKSAAVKSEFERFASVKIALFNTTCLESVYDKLELSSLDSDRFTATRLDFCKFSPDKLTEDICAKSKADDDKLELIKSAPSSSAFVKVNPDKSVFEKSEFIKIAPENATSLKEEFEKLDKARFALEKSTESNLVFEKSVLNKEAPAKEAF